MMVDGGGSLVTGVGTTSIVTIAAGVGVDATQEQQSLILSINKPLVE